MQAEFTEESHVRLAGLLHPQFALYPASDVSGLYNTTHESAIPNHRFGLLSDEWNRRWSVALHQFDVLTMA